MTSRYKEPSVGAIVAFEGQHLLVVGKALDFPETHLIVSTMAPPYEHFHTATSRVTILLCPSYAAPYAGKGDV